MYVIYAVRTCLCTYISEGYVQGSHSYGAIPQGTPAAGTLGGTGGSVGSGAFSTMLLLWLQFIVMIIIITIVTFDVVAFIVDIVILTEFTTAYPLVDNSTVHEDFYQINKSSCYN